VRPERLEEGWPLLTFETEANGDSWSTFGSLGLSTDFCPALAALVSPRTKYYFPRRTLFHFISPHRPATGADSRAGSPVSVFLCATFGKFQNYVCCFRVTLYSVYSVQKLIGVNVISVRVAKILSFQLEEGPPCELLFM
jgi:hypothetical protein